MTSFQNWLLNIPFDEWPQQPKLFGEARPAMVNDPQWQDLGRHAADFVEGNLKQHIAGLAWRSPMVSALMPGHFIATHVDPQGPDWLWRVHVPVWTNRSACLFMDTAYNLKTGSAYKVNVERKHACINHGYTPRVHFMFDVSKPNA
jgi:hypothetical protein